MQPPENPLLVPGRNCWRIERANRFALIVDASDYFRFAKAAMLRAQCRIMLIGWDFDTRISFEPEVQTLEGPNELGKFLSWLPKHRPDLQIYVLKWDLGMLQALGRGMIPLFIVDWITSNRLRFKLDGMHPVGAAHHQKIVVIDDALAFCGGIDMTVDRWDTPEHLDNEPHRKTPGGQPSGPWHDATTAIDGPAARALGDLARQRWQVATGEPLAPCSQSSDPWPSDLRPTLKEVDVAIARTSPEVADRKEVREIEALYLDAIGSAKQTIYVETQYLASRRIAEALARRLKDKNGPEIVLVLPETADGWLEHKAMDGARFKLLKMLWSADVHRRFGVYYPVTTAGNPIYVHAKILIADDWLLRVGSSNLNNRSMGFDTECDLVVEAAQTSDDERLREAIIGIRRTLLSEHLNVTPEVVTGVMKDAAGSVLKTVERLRGSGRTLKPFDLATIRDDESVLAESELLDPEKTTASSIDRLSRTLSGWFSTGP